MTLKNSNDDETLDFNKETAIFNMAIATLQRINNILIDLKFLNTHHNYLIIPDYLDELYKEVDPFLDDEETKEFKNDIEVMNKLHKKIKQDPTDHRKYYIPLHYKIHLREIEINLRRKLKKYKLLMAQSEQGILAISRGIY